MRHWRTGIGLLLGAAALAAGALAGCGGDDPASADVMVPASVQAMMDADFPADGEIHVQSRGKIVIEPTTEVCEVWIAAPERSRDNYFGINSDELFDPLGQSGSNSGGSDRQISAASEVCREPESVVIYGRKSDNRNGEPYKLVLAVWQGDPAKGGAVWVGGVERKADEYPVTPVVPADITDPKRLTQEHLSANIANDQSLLSKRFISFTCGECK